MSSETILNPHQGELTRPASEQVRPNTDPVLALIAKYDSLWDLICMINDKADALWLPAPKSKRELSYTPHDLELNISSLSPKRKAKIRAKFAAEEEQKAKEQEACGAAALYHQADELSGERNAVYDAIIATKPTSLAGAIAMLDMDLDDPDLINAVIAGLHDLQAKWGVA